MRQIGVVVKAEVLERAEQPPLERVPQPQLHRDAAVEPVEDALAVGALRRRGQAEQDLRLQVIQQPSIGRRGGVVELVDDDDVEGVGPNVVRSIWASDWIEAKTCRHSSGRWPSTNSSPKAPSRSTCAKGAEALRQDLPPVGDEQQRWDCRAPRAAGGSRGGDEVLPVPVAATTRLR